MDPPCGTGSAPTREELAQLQQEFKRLRGPVPRKSGLAFMLVGMSLERVMAIAAGVLEQR